MALIVSPDTFVARRRAKTPAQVEGVRRAQKAADAAMAVAAALIRELRPGLTAEAVREAMAAVADEHGADLPRDVIVAGGAGRGRGAQLGLGAAARRASRWSSTSGRGTGPRAAGRT